MPQAVSKSRYLILLPVFFSVVMLRWHFVNKYAVPLPFWDQWDAEGDFLLRPWIEETYKLTDLWDDHNEHRIFPTRILSLVIFELTHQWNNLTGARVNIVLAAMIPTLITYLLLKHRELARLRWLVVAVAVLQFCLPFAYENLLVGFQSQFYFLILFTVLAVSLASYTPLTVTAASGLCALCILSVITMASGLLTPLVVGVVLFINRYCSNKLSFKTLLAILAFGILGAVGYLTIPNLGANSDLKAKSIMEILQATLYILSWPFIQMQLPAFILWMPGLVALVLGVFRKDLSRTDVMMAGFFGWSFAQCFILAYGRGHGLTIVSSRYTELLTLGLIANGWFAVRLAESLRPVWLKAIPLLFFLAFFGSHRLRRKTDRSDIAEVHRLSLVQTTRIRQYYQTGDTTLLIARHHGEVPYPDPKRLRQLLDNPTLKSVLPPVVTQGTKK